MRCLGTTSYSYCTCVASFPGSPRTQMESWAGPVNVASYCVCQDFFLHKLQNGIYLYCSAIAVWFMYVHVNICPVCSSTQHFSGGPYSRKLLRENLSQKIQFSLRNLSQIAPLCCATLPNFAEKTFMNSDKTAKLTKVSPLEFPAIRY